MGMSAAETSPENHNCGQRQFGRILKSDHSGRILRAAPAVSGGTSEFGR